jgi:hypothetical protein
MRQERYICCDEDSEDKLRPVRTSQHITRSLSLCTLPSFPGHGEVSNRYGPDTLSSRCPRGSKEIDRKEGWPSPRRSPCLAHLTLRFLIRRLQRACTHPQYSRFNPQRRHSIPPATRLQLPLMHLVLDRIRTGRTPSHPTRPRWP